MASQPVVLQPPPPPGPTVPPGAPLILEAWAPAKHLQAPGPSREQATSEGPVSAEPVDVEEADERPLSRIDDAVLAGLTLEQALQERHLVRLKDRPVHHVDVFIREVVSNTVRDICSTIEVLLERLLAKDKFCQPMRELMLRVATTDVDRLLADLAGSAACRRWEALHAEVQELRMAITSMAPELQEERAKVSYLKDWAIRHEKATTLAAIELRQELDLCRRDCPTKDEVREGSKVASNAIEELRAETVALRAELAAAREGTGHLKEAVQNLERRCSSDFSARSDIEAFEVRLQREMADHEDAWTRALEGEQATRMAQLEQARERLSRCETAVAGLRTEAFNNSAELNDRMQVASAKAEVASTQAARAEQRAAEVAQLKETLSTLCDDVEARCNSILTEAKQEKDEHNTQLSRLREDVQALLRSAYSREHTQGDCRDDLVQFKASEEERNARVRRLRWEFDELRAHCVGARSGQEDPWTKLRREFDDVRRQVRHLAGATGLSAKDNLTGLPSLHRCRTF